MNLIEQSSTSEAEVFDLKIEVSAAQIVVKAGAVTIRGRGIVQLEDDYGFDLQTNADFRTDVSGYLVSHKATGALSVLVDELVCDGIDEPFYAHDSDHSVVELLFFASVPAGHAEFGDVVVRKVVAPVQAEDGVAS